MAVISYSTKVSALFLGCAIDFILWSKSIEQQRKPKTFTHPFKFSLISIYLVMICICLGQWKSSFWFVIRAPCPHEKHVSNKIILGAHFGNGKCCEYSEYLIQLYGILLSGRLEKSAFFPPDTCSYRRYISANVTQYDHTTQYRWYHFLTHNEKRLNKKKCKIWVGCVENRAFSQSLSQKRSALCLCLVLWERIYRTCRRPENSHS